LVEMALVLPVFMMVLLGIVEFGRAMMVSQLLANASREGARLAIVEGKAAPAFTLLNARGEKVSLGDFHGRDLILYFYPKADTPG
jgi:Flp pilus assembly protein TadG